jgi:hypothetical protein
MAKQQIRIMRLRAKVIAGVLCTSSLVSVFRGNTMRPLSNLRENTHCIEIPLLHGRASRGNLANYYGER